MNDKDCQEITAALLKVMCRADEEFQEHDPEVRSLLEKGRHFSLDDQALMCAQEARNRLGQFKAREDAEVLIAARNMAEQVAP